MLMIVGPCDDTPSLQDRTCTTVSSGRTSSPAGALAATSAARPDAASMPAAICLSTRYRRWRWSAPMRRGLIALLNQATQKALARD
jgi:hypothetical protein